MPENWPKGNTYVNHWDSPTYMVSVEDSKLRGGGHIIKQAIWDAAKDTIQEWTGEELTECSLYGIRVYTEGATLATHVDRLPLVSSAIVNVAQDVDEPWPIEVYGHDGKAYNVTMEPGEMVLVSTYLSFLDSIYSSCIDDKDNDTGNSNCNDTGNSNSNNSSCILLANCNLKLDNILV